MILFRCGDWFKDPESDHGYCLSRDVSVGDPIRTTDFIPINGTPEPIAGEALPDWLRNQIRRKNA